MVIQQRKIAAEYRYQIVIAFSPAYLPPLFSYLLIHESHTSSPSNFQPQSEENSLPQTTNPHFHGPIPIFQHNFLHTISTKRQNLYMTLLTQSPIHTTTSPSPAPTPQIRFDSQCSTPNFSSPRPFLSINGGDTNFYFDFSLFFSS